MNDHALESSIGCRDYYVLSQQTFLFGFRRRGLASPEPCLFNLKIAILHRRRQLGVPDDATQRLTQTRTALLGVQCKERVDGNGILSHRDLHQCWNQTTLSDISE